MTIPHSLKDSTSATLGRLTVGAFVTAVALALGIVSAESTAAVGVAALLLVFLCLAAIDLGLVILFAVPATLVMVRVGGALSVSDFVLAGSLVFALLLYDSAEARPMQPLLWGGAIYLLCLVPTLLLNRYAANVVEWVHEAVLVLGSLVVGWVIGRRGHARAALLSYVWLSSFIAVAAIVVALDKLATEGSFGPAYLPSLHKNFIGNSLAIAVIIAYARPPWLRFGRWTSRMFVVLCMVGIVASGSRQAIISTVVGVLIVAIRPRVDTHKRGWLIGFATIPAVVFVIIAVKTQIEAGGAHNSINQRIMWFDDAFTIWQSSPLFGSGLRWWYTDRTGFHFQPPNAEFEMLTSGGILGLLGFLVMFSIAAWVLTRMDPRYGTLALAIVLARFTQGQFDLYWVAGQASLLWIVAGIAYGLQVRESQGAP